MEEHGFLNISKLMHCGVYALLKKGEVIYIGKSKQPMMRIYTHIRNRGRKVGMNPGFGNAVGPAIGGKGIAFDSIWFLPCMLGQLGTLEIHFIKMYKPKHNVKHNPEPKPRPEKEPRVIMPIPDEIKGLLRQMIVISSLPPMEDTPKYIQRRL